MDKTTAIQNVVDATIVAVQAINDYGTESPHTTGALDAAIQAVDTAHDHGATDQDIRNARPQ
ncbi:hypothetical protein ACWD25_04075 [Streptomyces sp. NPDC002920]